ncbi:acyl-CoA dehydrogenase [Beggiatoa alba B18LD]|uniref:3-methylmercaptopropionyl-CoA dehydrogenase n=1 Tax=Beggiatoa alba B18LD TaxID=395493 RepID=I3CGZ5_9GAMM|nr:acyl-CoA dehydrogenase [Beggiatoa alba]EIJ42888.1 acyl-CoA dehydrogenase [Beggiatoa alba B18LD]
MTYIAPTRDMQFVINELADLATINSYPMYQDATAELVSSILDEANKLASEVLAPINYSGDTQGNMLKAGVVTTATGFKEAYAQFVENGWNGLHSNPDFGGQGLPAIVSIAVSEMWHAANMSFGLCPMLTQGAIEAIEHHGSDALKATYLSKLVEGTWTGTMNLTEPQAGSDLSAVRAKAVPNGDHYLISGQKIFITWGEHDMAENIIHLTLARTPDAPEGVKGISLFVVPKFLINADGSLGERNDAYCTSIEHKLGIHASPTAVMVFGDKTGAVGYLVGEENRGLEYMFTMMNHARLSVGLEGVAIAERAYQQALRYAKERIQGREAGVKGSDRVAIIKHPDIRRMLMSMKAQIEAMRAVAYVTAAYMDTAHGGTDSEQQKTASAFVDLLTPIVKGWCTESAIEITSTGVQIHGGMGFIEETGAAQHFRDARITTIYEGTTGIQASDLVGRKIARENGVTVKALMTEMQTVANDLAQATGDDCAAIHKAFTASLQALQEATDWILANFAQNPKQPLAVSVTYLRLFGIVAGGWQMARAALIAQAQLQRGQDPSFYEAKLITARFYAEHILSQTGGLAYSVVNGAVSALALRDEQF